MKISHYGEGPYYGTFLVVKTLVGAFNQEKAGVFSVIVKSSRTFI